MPTFVSQVNGSDIYAKRAEATRSGINLETFTPTGGSEKKGILPAGLQPGHEGTNDANILATQQYVLNQVGKVAEAMLYKGAVDSDHGLPDGSTPETKYKAGWTYKVAEAGTYAGQVCEVGDIIIANKDYVQGTASNADWDVIQTNIEGAVTGPASAVDSRLAAFDGTTGKVIKDSGVAVTGEVSGSSTNAQVPTAAAVHTAITGAVAALDANVTSAAGTKVQVEVTEVDGVVTGVTVTETGLDTALGNKADKVSGATANNFAGLDADGNLIDSGKKAADFKTKQTAKTDPTASGTTLDFIASISQDENGEITATKKSVTVDSTYSASGTNPVNGTAVAAALATLDAEKISTDGKNVQVKVTEVDGKVTAVNVTTDNSIGGVQLAGAAGALAPAGDNNTVTIPNAAPTGTGETNGLMTAADKAKLDGINQAVADSATPGTVTYTTVDL